MSWYYAVGQEQKGPVTDEQLEALAKDGVVTDDTLVWRDGLANWQAYREVRGGAAVAAPVAAAAGGVVCAQCGQTFTADQVVRFGDQFVCGACKPVFVQRMREGASAAPRAGSISADQLAQRDYEVGVGKHLGRGWNLFKEQTGSLIGATVLVYLVLLVVNVIPYLGSLLGLILNGALLGGLYAFYLKKLRNEAAVVGDAFSGFGPRFTQLMLTQIVTGILSGLCIVPGVMVLVFGLIASGAFGSGGGTTAMSAGVAVVGGLLTFIGFLGMVYLSVSWIFALLLVVDKKLDFSKAMSLSRRMVGKHFFGVLWLMIVIGLLSLLGMLACLVGLLVTGPVAFMAIVSLYEEIFRDLAPAEA